MLILFFIIILFFFVILLVLAFVLKVIDFLLRPFSFLRRSAKETKQKNGNPERIRDFKSEKEHKVFGEEEGEYVEFEETEEP